MTRIAAALMVAAGLSGWRTPATAQEALKSFSFGGSPHVERTSNLFLATPAGARFAGVPGVDPQVLRVAAPGSPLRATFSTAPVAGLAERVSWNRTHTALAGAFVVTLLMDAAQTRALARNGWSGFREANPLLGDRPSVGRVNSYTVLAGLSVLGAAAALPPRVRPWLLGAAIAVQALTVGSSVKNGLPIRFP